MSQIAKQIIIQQLFMSKDIQNAIKEFLFYTDETSPKVKSVHESKHTIAYLLQSECTLFLNTKPASLQTAAGSIGKWTVLIGKDHTRCTRGRGVTMVAYNCQICGDYYKGDDYNYYGRSLLKKIECKCFRTVYIYSHRDMYTRED